MSDPTEYRPEDQGGRENPLTLIERVAILERELAILALAVNLSASAQKELFDRVTRLESRTEELG